MPAQLPPALHGPPGGVYENSGIAVRIPPERVYEISRNQQSKKLNGGLSAGLGSLEIPIPRPGYDPGERSLSHMRR